MFVPVIWGNRDRPRDRERWWTWVKQNQTTSNHHQGRLAPQPGLLQPRHRGAYWSSRVRFRTRMLTGGQQAARCRADHRYRRVSFQLLTLRGKEPELRCPASEAL